MFAKQQEGEDTAELQRRLDTLRLEAAKQGVREVRGGVRGRAGFRGARGRAAAFFARCALS